MGVIHFRGGRAWAAVLLCLAGILANHYASAGGFTVTPVRIYMTPKDRAVAVTVTNDNDTEMVMQADLVRWKQTPDGKDELTPTEEIFLSPPILKIAAKSRQVVRLARIGSAKVNEQLTYRMIVREIPEVRKSSENTEVQIALAFNMPVFITPQDAKPKLDCTVIRVTVETVRAVCANSGNAHIHPVKLELSDSKGDALSRDDSGGYILANVTRSFDLKRKDAKISGGNGKLMVSFADGTNRSYDVSIPD